MRLKRTGITTKIIICILAVWAVTTIVSLRGQISRSRQENQELSAEAADLAGENEDMKMCIRDRSWRLVPTARRRSLPRRLPRR